MLKRIALIAALIAALSFGDTHPVLGDSHNQSFDVSLPNFILAPKEQIVSFRCIVAGGGILRVKTQYLWSTNIDNGTAELATLTANVIEGEAAFDKSALGFFKNFVSIQEPGDLGPNDRPFDISVEIGIAKDPQMSSYRTVKFPRKQLILKPTK